MWGVLFSAFMSVFAAIAPRLLLMFGFVAFSDTVTRPFFNHLSQMALSQLNGLPSEYRAIVELTGLPAAIGIVFSAYIAAIGIKAARGAMAGKGANFSNPTKGV